MSKRFPNENPKRNDIYLEMTEWSESILLGKIFSALFFYDSKMSVRVCFLKDIDSCMCVSECVNVACNCLLVGWFVLKRYFSRLK